LDHFYLVLEYMEHGSLNDIIEQFGVFPEVLAARYVHQVLEGLEYLHSHGIIHQDLRASNCLIDKEGGVSWPF